MASNLLLSYELITLMSWLLDNKKSKLRQMVQHAINNGLDQELEEYAAQAGEISNEEVHTVFVEFLMRLEEELVTALEKNEDKRPLHDHVVSSAKRLNMNGIDDQTLWMSIKQAEQELSKNEKQSAQSTQQLLLEKVLKNWNPPKKEGIN